MRPVNCPTVKGVALCHRLDVNVVNFELLVLYQEMKLRVFENMVLRGIFGPRRDEVSGGLEEIA